MEKMKDLLNQYANYLFSDSILDKLSSSKQEEKFLLRKRYEMFFQTYLNACTISADIESPEIDETGLELVMMRLLGIVAIAYLRRRNREDKSKINFSIELDQSKLDTSDEEKENDMNELFLQWAPLYTDYEERTYDRELLELDADIVYENLFDYMKERFGYASIGMKRLVDLTKLKTEMYKRLIKTDESDPALMWLVLANLAISSPRDIKGIEFPKWMR